MSAHRLRTLNVALAGVAATALLSVGIPTASADPATDALGFVDSSARCASPNTAVAFGSTATSRVAICKSPAGQYGYHGVRIGDGAKLVASATAGTDGSFVAKQDGVTYTVSSNALTVSDATGVVRREPMVSWHGPKSTQAPAGTQQTPAAKPSTPAAAPTSTAPTSTAPLPPPLPAEVGGKH